MCACSRDATPIVTSPEAEAANASVFTDWWDPVFSYARDNALVFDGNLLFLDDGVTLHGYGLHQQAEVTLLRSKSFKLPVKVNFFAAREEKAFDVDVEASDTIEAVKAKIQEKGQKEIRFIYGRIDDNIDFFRLEEGKSLSDYNIFNGRNGEIWIHCPDW